MNSSTYLMTIKDLEANAFACLGNMEEATYDEYEAKMKEVAAKAGITSPKMGIDIKFKPGANDFVTEQAYPILKREWEQFKTDAKTMCEYTPRVFVIDGSKFTLPI